MSEVISHLEVGNHHKQSFWEKHSSYVTVLWYISTWIGGIYGFIQLLYTIFNAIREGDFFAFVFAIVLNSLYVVLWAFIGGGILFLILLVLTFIPYLIIRGLLK